MLHVVEMGVKGRPVGVVAVDIRPEGTEDGAVHWVEWRRVEWCAGIVGLEERSKGFMEASGSGEIEREEGVVPFAGKFLRIDGGGRAEIVAGGYEETCDDGAGVADEARGRTGGMPELVVGLVDGRVEAPRLGYGGADEG